MEKSGPPSHGDDSDVGRPGDAGSTYTAPANSAPSALLFLDSLPAALTLAIMKRLDVSSVGKLACVSRHFREAARDPEVSNSN